MNTETKTSAGILALFGGPAGSGKSTLAKLWCQGRSRAVRIDFDSIGNLIVSGKADFQIDSELQKQQLELCARASCSLARNFVEAGYDVTIDHVFSIGDLKKNWRPYLKGIDCRIVIVYPRLDVALERAAARTKNVREDVIKRQHEWASEWPERHVIDTSDLDIEASLKLAEQVLDSCRLWEG